MCVLAIIYLFYYSNNDMDEHNLHDTLLKEITKEYAVIFKNPRQGVYIYLDDDHKVCNEKFATLLGYQSAKAWAKVKENFPEKFVAEESREILVDTYQNAMEHSIGSKINVTWQKESGDKVATEVILVPVSFQGHLFAFHFVTQ